MGWPSATAPRAVSTAWNPPLCGHALELFLDRRVGAPPRGHYALDISVATTGLQLAVYAVALGGLLLLYLGESEFFTRLSAPGLVWRSGHCSGTSRYSLHGVFSYFVVGMVGPRTWRHAATVWPDLAASTRIPASFFSSAWPCSTEPGTASARHYTLVPRPRLRRVSRVRRPYGSRYSRSLPGLLRLDGLCAPEYLCVRGAERVIRGPAKK